MHLLMFVIARRFKITARKDTQAKQSDEQIING
jgi:hypothetical protein